MNDWTRKGPLPDIGGQRRVSDRSGFSSGPRGFDNNSEAGSDRGGRRQGYEQNDGRVRDLGNWDRKGPLTPILPNGPAARNTDRPVSHDGPRDRRNSPAWGEGRSQDGSRPPRREFSERPFVDRVPTAPELDNQWRTKMRPDAPPPPPPPPPAAAPARSPALSSRETSAPSSPAAPPGPQVRPKLNLAKRTLTEADTAASPSTSSDSKSSPFGAAKPIDTAAREKEIEEKRQLALREKKEADEKAREEKRLLKAAEKVEKAEKTSVSTEKPNGIGTEKENGVIPTHSGKNFEILRRTANKEADTATDEANTNDASWGLVNDKAVKPKEIITNVSSNPSETDGLTNGNSTSQAGTSIQSSADVLEEDGWSTVPKSRNNRRNGNQATRAIAS